MSWYQPITERVRDRIAAELGPDCVTDAPETRARCSGDGSGLEHVPELVVFPRATAHVERLLRLANELRFPVTPRGAGTGLAGGCLPVRGGAVLSLERMDRILSVDPANLVAEVEPGVITKRLRDAAREKGLLYPPDPAGLDESTVGGNAATNAGGPACLKYGTTRDYVLGLEVVLPTGRAIRTGVKTRKGVVGYDLTHLFVGSEGTLGVITGLTLKLLPHPPAVAGLAAVFPDLRTATRAVSAVMAAGRLPSAVEFMDYRSLGLVADLLPFEVPGERAAVLILEVDGTPEHTRREAELAAALFRETGATHVLPAETEAERERIWAARRRISLRVHESAGLYISEDVVVPIGRIAELVDAVPGFEEAFGLSIYTFGHAGDGNIHLNITAPGPDHAERAERGVRALLERVLAMDGTMSGEHGIGVAKARFLPLELSAESMRVQRGIRDLLDPNAVLNPGKIFPEDGGGHA